MMKGSLNKKTYIGDIEPNPKEFGIWVKQDGTAKVYDYIKDEWKGGSGNGESSTIEYLDVSAVDFTKNHNSWLLYNSYLVAIKATYVGMNATFIAPTSSILNSIKELEDVSYKHVAIDINCETLNIIDGDKSILTIKDVAINRGWTQEQLDAIPRITKEEFYSLT